MRPETLRSYGLSQGPDAVLLNHLEDMLAILGIYAQALKSIA